MLAKYAKRPRGRFALPRPPVLYSLFLIVLWFVESLVGDDTWLTSLLLYVPQQIFALPLGVFGLMAAKQRQWFALFYISVYAAIFCLTFLGFRWRWNSQSQSSASSVTVISYNIEQLQSGPESLHFILNQHQPDILCLQEAHPSQGIADPLPRIRQLLPNWNASRYGELVTLTRHKVLRSTIHRLPTRVGSGILETVILVQDERLTIFNVHFNIPIEGVNGLRPSVMGNTAIIRHQQLDLLQKLTQNCRTDFVIAGDFNTPPRGPFYGQLSSHYRDTFVVAGRGSGNTWHAKLPLSRIDYIFVSRNFRVLNNQVLSLKSSDHRPVLCEVEIQ